MTGIGGRSGGLTMTSGATLRMQINGTAANNFDSLSATGNIVLGGATLDLLINPQATSTAEFNDAYSPNIGDTFDILTIAPAPVPGDYDRNGSVGNEDYAAWRAAFGNTTGIQAADGNNNGVVDAADYVIWRKHLGESSSVTGAISGTLLLNILDPNNWLSSAGATAEIVYASSTLVQVKIVAASGAASGIARYPSRPR